MNRFNPKTSLFLTVLVLFFIGCQPAKSPEESGATNPELLHGSLHLLTQIMVNDIFSPPVASRVYAYSAVAAYEAIAINSEEHTGFAGQLQGLENGPESDNEDIVLELAAVHALLEVGEELIFSTEMIKEYQDSVYGNLKSQGLSSAHFDASIAYGDKIAAHIIDWAKKDNYNETRGTEKYPVTNEAGRWIPTPPSYMDAIEPSRNKIRTMVMETADQFKPAPPRTLHHGKRF